MADSRTHGEEGGLAPFLSGYQAVFGVGRTRAACGKPLTPPLRPGPGRLRLDCHTEPVGYRSQKSSVGNPAHTKIRGLRREYFIHFADGSTSGQQIKAGGCQGNHLRTSRAHVPPRSARYATFKPQCDTRLLEPQTWKPRARSLRCNLPRLMWSVHLCAEVGFEAAQVRSSTGFTPHNYRGSGPRLGPPKHRYVTHRPKLR